MITNDSVRRFQRVFPVVEKFHRRLQLPVCRLPATLHESTAKNHRQKVQLLWDELRRGTSKRFGPGVLQMFEVEQRRSQQEAQSENNRRRTGSDNENFQN